MANQFAAMPSLHVGWAFMVAVFLIRASRSRWRWLCGRVGDDVVLGSPTRCSPSRSSL